MGLGVAPDGVGEGDGVGVGVGVGVGDGLAEGLPLGPGVGVGVATTLKLSTHVNPLCCGHCKPLGPSVNAYVTMLPLGMACGDPLGDAAGAGVVLTAACGFTGGFTPGAAVPPNPP